MAQCAAQFRVMALDLASMPKEMARHLRGRSKHGKGVELINEIQMYCEEKHWKKFEEHYELKFRLGLDESRHENKLRILRWFGKHWRIPEHLEWNRFESFKNQLMQWKRWLTERELKLHQLEFYEKRILQRKKGDWDRLLLIATENVCYAEMKIIYSNRDVAKVKKFMRGVEIMNNLGEIWHLVWITMRLSYVLGSMKNCELLRQLVRMVCKHPYVIERAAAEFGLKRWKLCVRHGLVDVIECRQDTSGPVEDVLTFLNSGHRVIEEHDSSLYLNYDSNRCFFRPVPRFGFDEYLGSRLSRRGTAFWIAFTGHCYLKILDTSSESASRPKDWYNALRYVWRSVIHPYPSIYQFRKFFYFSSNAGVFPDPRLKGPGNPLFIDLCEWYVKEVCDDPVFEICDYERNICTPRCLQQYCRVAIRAHLLKRDRDLVQQIDKLELTTNAKEYLKLKR